MSCKNATNFSFRITTDMEPDYLRRMAEVNNGPLDRLVEEKNQLNDRIIKLTAFLESDALSKIPPLQVNLLKIQQRIMLSYEEVLHQRLLNWEYPTEMISPNQP